MALGCPLESPRGVASVAATIRYVQHQITDLLCTGSPDGLPACLPNPCMYTLHTYVCSSHDKKNEEGDQEDHDYYRPESGDELITA